MRTLVSGKSEIVVSGDAEGYVNFFRVLRAAEPAAELAVSETCAGDLFNVSATPLVSSADTLGDSLVAAAATLTEVPEISALSSLDALPSAIPADKLSAGEFSAELSPQPDLECEVLLGSEGHALFTATMGSLDASAVWDAAESSEVGPCEIEVEVAAQPAPALTRESSASAHRTDATSSSSKDVDGKDSSALNSHANGSASVAAVQGSGRRLGDTEQHALSKMPLHAMTSTDGIEEAAENAAAATAASAYRDMWMDSAPAALDAMYADAGASGDGSSTESDVAGITLGQEMSEQGSNQA